jgi:uncharacterized protein
MSDNVLGAGLDFPYAFQSGIVKFAEGQKSVEAAIRMVLNTRKGSRFMLPEYGSELYKVIFEPCDEGTGVLATAYANDAIARWVTRISRFTVEFVLEPAQHRIVLVITYSLHRDPQANIIVYPFYLQRTDALSR